MRASRVVLLLILATMFAPQEASATPVRLSFYLAFCSGASIGRIPVSLDSGDKIQGSFNLTGPSQLIQLVSFSILTEGGLGTVYELKESTLSASNSFNFTANPTGYSFPIQSNRYLLDFSYDTTCSGSSPNVGVQLEYDIIRQFNWWLIAYGGAAAAVAVGVVYLAWYRSRNALQKKLEKWAKN